MPDGQPQGPGSASLSPPPRRPHGPLPRLLAWCERLLARLAGAGWYGDLDAPQAVPYRISCACGQVVSGLRQARFQVVPCPACRARLFVLPRSPRPPVPGAPAAELQPAAPPPARPRRRHRVLILLGLAVLLGAGASIVAVWLRSRSGPGTEAERSALAVEAIGPRLRRAEQLLGQGQFHQALAEADAALALAARQPAGLSRGNRLVLTQVRRQAALLVDLSAESLEEILGHGAGLPAPEWEATFRRRYRGKALVLDTEVARTAAGRYRDGWRVLLGGEEARLELDGLKLLDSLPLQGPRRLVFGARLASARRQPPGAWVVRLEPDSGVLLTDPGAAALCCAALADADARQVLRRQRSWAVGPDLEQAAGNKDR